MVEGRGRSDRTPHTSGPRLLGTLGLACILGMAVSGYAHPDADGPADPPANISVNFATDFVNYDWEHCQDAMSIEWCFGTTGNWSSSFCGSGSSECTVNALADETNDYVETRMNSTPDPPHCTENSADTTMVAYTRRTLTSNRAALTEANLHGGRP